MSSCISWFFVRFIVFEIEEIRTHSLRDSKLLRQFLGFGQVPNKYSICLATRTRKLPSIFPWLSLETLWYLMGIVSKQYFGHVVLIVCKDFSEIKDFSEVSPLEE